MWNESTSSIQVYIQLWFHDEQGAILLWPEITLGTYSWVTLFLTVSCRIKIQSSWGGVE